MLDAVDDAVDDANTAIVGGNVCVYTCVDSGFTVYLGISNDVRRRGKQHLKRTGIEIEEIEGLTNLSKADARAVEQMLIHYNGLGRQGGTLINKINSISPTRNPTAYEQALIRGAELLKSVEYPGFN